MSNAILQKEWIKWYPKKLYLKNIKNNTMFIPRSNLLKEEKFYEDLNYEIRNQITQKSKEDNTELKQIDLIKTKSYEDGFKQGLLEAQKENVILKNKLNTFFLEFEKSFAIIENKLYTSLIKIILKISSYIVSKNIRINELILANHIKKIIGNEGTFLKKPQLLIHSDNKTFIEKIFKDFLNSYKWKLIYDDSIDVNSFKVKSESGNIDATVDARWQELYRFIDSEEY